MLTGELSKAEQNLKEIMRQYETELQALNQQAVGNSSIANDALRSRLMLEKELEVMSRQLRDCKG